MEIKDVAFSAQGNSIDVAYDDDRFCVVSIDLLHEDEQGECNRNMCNISHQANVDSVDSIKNTTITCRYNSNVRENVTDIVEHYTTPKELFETRIIGHFPPDTRIKFVERANGKTYLNVEGIIHKKLVPEFMKILKESNNDLNVSTVLRCKGYQDEESGIFYIQKWTLQTTTVLSDRIMEGIENSHLEVADPNDMQISNANEMYMRFSKNINAQNIFEQIKNKQEKEISNVNLGVNELRSRLWDCLKKYEYSDGSWRGKRYWIHNILTDTKEVIVYDNQTDEFYKIPYKVSKEGDVTVKEEERKKVVEDKNYREVANTLSFAKEEYGEGEEITVDKSKDSVSEKDWGKVNKVALRNVVLNAKNYKELVYDVYLVVEDGWEEAPSEKLKYPVMEIKGGKAVYNRYALASALGYAKANDEKEVVKKVEKLYKDLEIEDKKDDETETEKKNSDWEAKCILAQNECEQLKNKCAELENKCSELENKCKELSEKIEADGKELEEFRKKNAIEEMKAYLDSYKKSFNKEEYEVMASLIEKSDKKEFCDKVDEKVKEFVRKMSEEKEKEPEEETEVQNSFDFMRFYNVPKQETGSALEKVINKLNNK